jgi:hypothetical protein
VERLRHAKYFISIDCFKGYSQFPLAEQSLEVLTFALDVELLTSIRLLQGQTAARFLFRNGMPELLWFDCSAIYWTRN